MDYGFRFEKGRILDSDLGLRLISSNCEICWTCQICPADFCSAEVLSGRELRPCQTFCPAGFSNTHKMSNKENKNDHWYLIFPVINWGKCLTEVKMSGRTLKAKNNFRDHWVTVWPWPLTYNPTLAEVKVDIIMWRLVTLRLIHVLFRSSSTKHVWQAWLDLVQMRPAERSQYHNIRPFCYTIR